MSFLRFLVTAGAAAALSTPLAAQIDTVQTVAPGVYFHQGDIRRGHSNNGWIVLDDFVLVVEANFPSGAKGSCRDPETTEKTGRFAFTRIAGDHVRGTRAEAGATIVANEGVDGMDRRAGFFGGPPGR
jgi:hypothetical protein